MRSHQADVAHHGLPSIDVVVCNLYPFAANQHLTDDKALVEFIDVGESEFTASGGEKLSPLRRFVRSERLHSSRRFKKRSEMC